MLILGIDTATPWGTIALCEDGKVHFEVSLRKLKGGGEYLLALLKQLLDEVGKELQEVDLIAVGNGPGSYTGIRVGLAAVLGLAEGLQLPVYQVSTLKIIAANCRMTSPLILAVIDARREQVYGALYQSEGSGLVELRPPAPWGVRELAESFDETAKVLICGDGSKAYEDIWRKYPQFKLAPSEWDRPLGSMAAYLARNEETQGNLNLNELQPAYLKRVEAEVRLEESDGQQQY